MSGHTFRVRRVDGGSHVRGGDFLRGFGFVGGVGPILAAVLRPMPMLSVDRLSPDLGVMAPAPTLTVTRPGPSIGGIARPRPEIGR
jgi:hypothetical protein